MKKSYKITGNYNAQIVFFISKQQSNNLFIGSIAALDTATGQWQTEHLADHDEDIVYQKCDNWVSDYLKGSGSYNIVQL